MICLVCSQRHQTDILYTVSTEEPGLGKTLECIALILLNPGIGRNPTVTRWDPEAKVEVKQITVCNFYSLSTVGLAAFFDF